MINRGVVSDALPAWKSDDLEGVMRLLFCCTPLSL